MGYEVLHGIVDCLWVIGEPISVFKEAVERETGILTEVDTYDWITFLPMADGPVGQTIVVALIILRLFSLLLRLQS